LIDRTLIIATTEHGCTWADRPGVTSEGLCVPYDEASRIPMMVRCPSLFPQGKVWNSGVSLVDLMPTILDATGIWNEQPVRQMEGGGEDLPALQGRSWLKEIHSGQDTWTRPVVTENIARARIEGSFSEDRGIRLRNQKLILRKFETAPFYRPGEFYDLSADPGELHNLYASREHRPAIEEMRQQLSTWGRETRDQLSVELAQNVA
jgi:N-acetylglucosamine-6-sulfatase